MTSHRSLQRVFIEHVVPLSLAFLLLTPCTAISLTNRPNLPSQTRPLDKIAGFQTIPSGLTYDRCTAHADCVSPRTCQRVSNHTSHCADVDCCFPPNLRFCTSSEECISGEVCAKPDGQVPRCASAAYVDADPEVQQFFRPNGTGLTGDSCGITDACRPPRLCKSSGTICNGDRNCTCTPPRVQHCSSSSQCIPGERCLLLSDGPICQSSELKLFQWNSSKGLTGDFCRSSDECEGDRRCGDGPKPCLEINRCFCVGPELKLCSRTENCVEGEICAALDREDSGSLCFSKQAAPYHGLEEVTPVLGLQKDACVSKDDCLPPRDCVPITLIGNCRPGLKCVCLPPGIGGCESNSDCNEGEICFFGGGKNGCLKASPGLEEGLIPVANHSGNTSQAEATLTLPAIQPRCIGNHLLSGVSRDDLLFEEDVQAHVLCDGAGNCATPGHVIIFKGQAMMMKSYCALAGCFRRVMAVNSPKYKKRLRIRGLTEEVEFSALAAQYETRFEELFMKFMVRVGL